MEINGLIEDKATLTGQNSLELHFAVVTQTDAIRTPGFIQQPTSSFKVPWEIETLSW